MTAPKTLNDSQLAEGQAQVKGWMKLTEPGSYYKCESGGFLVNVGEAFPVWRDDMGAVRLLLLERDLAEAPQS